jgi:hypothetical protein
MSQGPESTEADDQEWRFGIDDVGPEAEPEVPEPDPIEPEPISFEHAAFVVIGIVLTLAIIATAL